MKPRSASNHLHVKKLGPRGTRHNDRIHTRLIKSFDRPLRATNRSERTREKYTMAARQLGAYLEAEGGPDGVADIRRAFDPRPPVAGECVDDLFRVGRLAADEEQQLCPEVLSTMVWHTQSDHADTSLCVSFETGLSS